jgi:hypothetical protein
MVKKILLLETVSVISDSNAGTLSKVHSSPGIETESVNITSELHAKSKMARKTQKRDVYLLMPSVIESSVFSFVILPLMLTHTRL